MGDAQTICDGGHRDPFPHELDWLIHRAPPQVMEGAVVLQTNLSPVSYLAKEFIKDVEDYLSDQDLRFTYVGVQSSYDSPLKDLILFHAPRTGSTLAVPVSVLQMAKGDAIALVRARVAQNEEEFLRGTIDDRDD